MDMSDYELQQHDIELLKSLAIQDWDRQFEIWEEEAYAYSDVFGY